MPEIFMVVISLMCLMIANILIGKKIADLKQEYNKTKLINGISKAVFSLISLVLIYISTMIYPMDIAEINGEMVSTLTGTTILLKAAILIYGGKVLIKIKDLFMVDIPIIPLSKDEEKED